jgi:hypothetical protein
MAKKVKIEIANRKCGVSKINQNFFEKNFLIAEFSFECEREQTIQLFQFLRQKKTQKVNFIKLFSSLTLQRNKLERL